MKDDQENDSLLYHAMHSRPMPGCLPLFFLIAAIIVGALMLCVDVAMPQPIRPKGIGQVTFRNDEITAMRMQLHSPLPLLLPVYADPSRKDSAAGHILPDKFTPEPAQPPAQPLFESVPASMVADETRLLTLPPPPNPGKEPTP